MVLPSFRNKTPAKPVVKHGLGIVMDGLNDSIIFPNLPELNLPNQLSIYAEFVMPNSNSFHAILTKGSLFGGQSNYSLGLYNKLLYFDTYSNGIRRNIVFSMTSHIDKTVRVLASYDGSNQIVYINDVEVMKTPFSGSLDLLTDSLFIGSRLGSSYFMKTENLKKIQIYNKSKTPDKLDVNGRVLDLDFTDRNVIVGNKVYDRNGKEGTLYGNPTQLIKTPKRVLYAYR